MRGDPASRRGSPNCCSIWPTQPMPLSVTHKPGLKEWQRGDARRCLAPAKRRKVGFGLSVMGFWRTRLSRSNGRQWQGPPLFNPVREAGARTDKTANALHTGVLIIPLPLRFTRALRRVRR
jgi:hypothetical protein